MMAGELASFISDEFVRAAGLDDGGTKQDIGRGLIWFPARRVSRLAVDFDADVALHGLPAACRGVTPRFAVSVSITGAERVPASGPLLIASNHPGAFDGFLVVGALRRSDVMVALSDSAFFRALPNVSGHLIYISPDSHQRMGTLRAMVRHLRAGGALFTYPAGLPEPDPEVMPGADAGLESWSSSLELLLRYVPETQLIISIVSGVLAKGVMGYPYVRRMEPLWTRQRLGEYAQVTQQLLFGRRFALRPHVSFGAPFRPAEVADSEVMPLIIGRARSLLAEHCAWASAQHI